MDEVINSEPPREIADEEWEQWMLEQELRTLDERKASDRIKDQSHGL